MLLLTCAVFVLHVTTVAGQTRVRSETPATPAVRQVDAVSLASVRRLVHAVARQQHAMDAGQRVAAWTDVSLVLSSVVAVPSGTSSPALSFEQVYGAIERGQDLPLYATAGVGARDEAADRLLALGYSAGEVADVLGRRITQQALDRARLMIATGGDRQAAADYLDRQYRRIRAAQTPPAPVVPSGRGRLPATSYDAFIERYAAQHRVDPGVVRAIMATESNFNPAARSRAGAIGLMQLMPGTARELGVNPLVPEQNIEGGVRYFAQLLKMFGRLELALVAYNAGPGFAERYASGKTGLYGETRDYVARVLRRLGLGR